MIVTTRLGLLNLGMGAWMANQSLDLGIAGHGAMAAIGAIIACGNIVMAIRDSTPVPRPADAAELMIVRASPDDRGRHVQILAPAAATIIIVPPDDGPPPRWRRWRWRASEAVRALARRLREAAPGGRRPFGVHAREAMR